MPLASSAANPQPNGVIDNDDFKPAAGGVVDSSAGSRESLIHAAHAVKPGGKANDAPGSLRFC